MPPRRHLTDDERAEVLAWFDAIPTLTDVETHEEEETDGD